ncbi:MAG: menaquinone biosynthesis protein [Planctomycetota bacterium]
MTNPAVKLQSQLRIGAVNYLNSKPLVYRLAERTPACKLLFDLPSRLADSLAAGRLDVALVPVVEYFSDPAYRLVSDACVASGGPVRSVKVYFRRPPAEVRTLALDEGSRTSASLARVLLKERFGIEPERSPLPLGMGANSVNADAVLLIGDRAMLSPAEAFVETWDLATEWRKQTGLPFVFACWVARPDVPATDASIAEVAGQLAAARDAGAKHLPEIAAEHGPPIGISADAALDYLKRNLHFRLGADERRSLDLFRQQVAQLGIVPPVATATNP